MTLASTTRASRPQHHGIDPPGNQGISLGWEDVYDSDLLRIVVNLPLPGTAVAPLVERNDDDNVLELPMTIAET